MKKINSNNQTPESSNKSGFFQRLGNSIHAYFIPNEEQKDMLRYQPHKSAYWLCMFAILLDCLGFCFVYSTLENVEWTTGVDIIFNILFLLVTFVTAENIKVYNKTASYIGIIIGALEIGHFFWYSLPLYTAGDILTWVMVGDLVCFIAAGAFLLIAGIANFYKSTALNNYLHKIAETDASARLELEQKAKKSK